MKDASSIQPHSLLNTRISSLTLCIRIALGIAVTAAAVCTTPVFAEGSKQWAPTSSDYAALGVMETGSANSATYPFAGYDQPADNRLYIHIDDPANEVVYIGLGNMTGNAGDTKSANYYWRIKAPDGTVVHGANMAGGASSNLNTHAQAVAGPDVLNASGYATAGNWTFDPAAAGKGAGDYYIEFDIDNNAATVGTFVDSYNGLNYGNSSNLNINWFDITVASKGASPAAIDGRVWSKNWGVRVNNPAVYPTAPFGTPFNGSMYAYDSEGYVTKVDFLNSGIRPLQGQFSFNKTGTGSSGNKENDRKSVARSNQTNPLHKIFLNSPDTNIYPLGADGSLQNLPLSINNINNTDIKVEATHPGSVEIILDINKDGVYTAGVDRRLLANVTSGVNYITWDGKNGAGNKVAKASFPVDVMITYSQGETHFTAYDVEGLDNGFQVFTHSSGGLSGPNLLFWDDSNINYTNGFEPNVVKVNVDTGATTRQKWNYVYMDPVTGASDGYGDLNTINTWWFAYRDYQSTVLVANNLQPIATDDSATTAEDTTLNGSTVLNNDSDPDGDTLTVNTVPVTQPSHGTLTLNSNGTYTYVPTAGYHGTDSFVYQISDGNGGTATATVNITITSVNDLPVATNDTGSTSEDTPLTGSTVLANDTDADGDTLTINTTPVTAPAHGSVAINADGTYVYTPNAGYHGTDSFVYQISDGNGGTANGTVNITVTSVNDLPVANNDSASTNEDTPVNGSTVLANDTDADGDTLTINTTPVTAPAHGSVVINANGTYTYTPSAGYHGTDSFVYQISDGNGGTANATVNITIVSVNDPPVANSDTATTDEDTPVNGSTVLANDTDTDNDTLTINTSPVTPPAHGSVVINADGTYTYTPIANYHGTDSFAYGISDGQGGSDTTTVTITINPVNDVPVATDDTASIPEDTVLNGSTVLSNDSDLDGDNLTVNTTPVTAPAHGTLALNANGTYTYTPAAHYHGTDSFTYEISDGKGGTDTATVTITITPVNDPPVATDDSATTAEDTVLNGSTVLSNDSDLDGDTLTVNTTPVSAPTHGTLALNANGTYTYTPASNYFGTDSFSYEISDGNGGTDTEVVNITITSVNDAPVITSVNNVTFAENGTGTALDVQTSDDTDAETAGLTYSLLPVFDSPLFDIDPVSGKITFKTPPDYEAPADSNGDNAYILMTKVCDSGGLCTDQVEVIVVTNVQETNPPNIISTVTKTPENQTYVSTVAATDPDNGDTLTFSITGGADAGLFTINPTTGELSFNTAPNFENPQDADQNNEYDVTITVTDNTAPDHTDTQTMRIIVTDANETPTLTSNGGGVTAALDHPENTSVVTTVTATDVDAGDVLTYSITGGTDQNKFTINPTTGELSFVNAPDFENPADNNADNVYQVEVSVNDKGSLPDQQMLTITVVDRNDAPVITSNGGGNTGDLQLAENTLPATTVTSTDQDGDIPAYSITGGTDAGLFSIDPATGALAFTVAPDFEHPTDADGNNVYAVEVTVNDGQGGVDVQQLNITITDANEAPAITSNGGGDTAALTQAENTKAATTVTANDPDAGDTLTYSISGGPDAALFTIDPNTGALGFVAAPDFENPTDANINNIYQVNVTVTDSKGQTDVQTLEISITDANDAPAISSDGGGDTASITLDENLTLATTVTSTDADGDAPAYSISGGADAALFSIDPVTGSLTFKTAPDFENPGDADSNNVYDVVVTVDDGKGSTDTQTLSITVANANDAPVISSDGGTDTASLNINENSTAVTTATSTDQDGDTPAYSIAGGSDAALFTIDPATGAIGFITAPDFENPTDANSNNSYEVVIKVEDGNGGSDTQALSVTVLNVNDPPEITSDGGGDSAALTASENQIGVTSVVASDDDGDTLTYSINGGVDAALFAINNVTGKLVFVKDPDFETPKDNAGGTSGAGDNIYEVEVKVVDGKGGTDIQNITVTVQDANEAPGITSDGGDTTATVHADEEQMSVTTVTATDPDAGDTLAYSITGGPDFSLFSIDPTTGVLTFKIAPNFENPADTDKNNQYIVEVTVSDSKGSYDVQTLTVVVDNTNDAPVITSDGGGALAALNMAENSTLATTVKAADSDNNTLTYSIKGGTDAALFSIDPATGALSFINAPDAENPTDTDKNNVYNIEVMVDDGKGGTDTQVLDITVSSTNEAPQITSDGGAETASLTLDENTVSVTTVTSTDPDSDTPAYSISGGADAALFQIDPATGLLSFKAAPDFETPADSNADNMYEVTVMVSDGNGKSDAQTLNITIKDDKALTLQVRTFLQGTYDPGTGMMADNLRRLGILPTTQPYAPVPTSHAGKETLDTAVAAVEGENAVVDWLLVDLRDANNPATILQTQAAMLQRDGDLVNAQTGSNNLVFKDTQAGDYFVSVRHRNHLGVMTATAVRLTEAASMVDFTNTTTAAYGSDARLEVGQIALMWAGDANQTQQVIANGPYNDTGLVLGSVLVSPENKEANSNFRLRGYNISDLNLDGITLFAGPGNDINLLLGNVLLHPANTLMAANYIVNGSLPK